MAKRSSDNKSQPGRLRIVAGNWRSRLLDIADVPGLRPTSTRVRETLFNWLAPRIHGARCLDLFAGTGALGLEALSRGAASCDFVEKSKVAARTLQTNIDLLQAEGATVHQAAAAAYPAAAKPVTITISYSWTRRSQPKCCQNCVDFWWRAMHVGEGRSNLHRRRPQPAFDRIARHVAGAEVEGTAGNVRYSLLANGDET